MPATYRLEAKPLEYLLSTLKAKYEGSRTSRFKKICFVLFQINGYAFPALYVLTDYVNRELLVYVYFTAMLSFVSLLVLLILNLPLIRVVWRQHKLLIELNDLGIEEASIETVPLSVSSAAFIKKNNCLVDGYGNARIHYFKWRARCGRFFYYFGLLGFIHFNPDI